MAVNKLAPYQLRAAQDPPDDYGPARFDADGRLEYKSRLYAGTTLVFTGSTFSNGRKYYHCAECTRICRKYARLDEAADLSTRFIIVVDGRIVERDPDLAGTNCGHLCQKPNVVAMIEAQQKLMSGVVDTKDWLAPYRLPPANDPPADHGPAQFDADGRVKFKSRLYAGVTLTFTLTSSVTAKRKVCYCCAGCKNILKKYWYIPEARLRTRSITVADGRILGRDPDLAGSDCGHLCQKPNVVAMIEEKQKLKREAAAKNQGNSEALSEPLIAKWLEPYKIPDAHDPQNDFGPVQYDDYGRIEFRSRLHAGATLLFRRAATSRTGKHYFYCRKCEDIFGEYRHIPLGLRRRNVTVVDGRIVGRDPEVAGSDCGHLCQKPNVIAMIEGNLERVNRGQPAIVDEIPLAAAVDLQLQEDDDDIIFVEHLPRAAPQNREQTKSSKAQPGMNEESSAGRASTSRRSNEPQAAAPPRKRAKTDCAARGPSKVPSKSTEADGVNVTGGVGSAPAVAVTHAAAPPDDPFGGFQPVLGVAVPAGPTSVTFEGVFGTYTFELAKGGSRLVGGVWVPIKSYRCVECLMAMERAGRRQDVPFVLVVNGSFVKRDPEFPMGTNHFCSEGGN